MNVYLYVGLVLKTGILLLGIVRPQQSANTDNMNIVVTLNALESKQGKKIATYALPLPHKIMHKIRLNTVFILFRAEMVAHRTSTGSLHCFVPLWASCTILNGFSDCAMGGKQDIISGS